MEKTIDKSKNLKCKLHQNEFTFFCFDEKEFVCNECYKFHRGHKLEIKNDIEDKAKSLESLRKSDQTKILDLYASYRDSLEEIGNQIEKEISNTNEDIDNLKKNNNLSLPKNKTLFDLSFEEYEAIENLNLKWCNINNVRKKIDQVMVKMSSTFNEYYFKPLYNESKWLQKEIDIIDNSPYHIGFPPQIIINQQIGDYYLSEGNKNHFITFDMKNDYYIKGFKIKLSDFDCTLKNFTVSILKNGTFVLAKSYICPHYNSLIEWNDFELNEMGKIIKINLIDNWGESGGNYMLIKEIQFKVAVVSVDYSL